MKLEYQIQTSTFGLFFLLQSIHCRSILRQGKGNMAWMNVAKPSRFAYAITNIKYSTRISGDWSYWCQNLQHWLCSCTVDSIVLHLKALGLIVSAYCGTAAAAAPATVTIVGSGCCCCSYSWSNRSRGQRCIDSGIRCNKLSQNTSHCYRNIAAAPPSVMCCCPSVLSLSWKKARQIMIKMWCQYMYILKPCSTNLSIQCMAYSYAYA